MAWKMEAVLNGMDRELIPLKWSGRVNCAVFGAHRCCSIRSLINGLHCGPVTGNSDCGLIADRDGLSTKYK